MARCARERLAQTDARRRARELPDELGVPAAGEVGLDPLLERVQPQLVEPERLRHEQAALGDVGERRSAPQRERLRRTPRRPRPAARREAPRRRASRAARSGRRRDRRARRAARRRRRASRSHRGRARAGGPRRAPARRCPRSRGAGSPHTSSTRRPADTGPIGPDHEHRQHGAAASASEGDGTIALVRLERPENPVVVHAARQAYARAHATSASGGRPARRSPASPAQRGGSNRAAGPARDQDPQPLAVALGARPRGAAGCRCVGAWSWRPWPPGTRSCPV